MGRKHRKAPAGCFWRGDTLYGRTRIKGRLLVWSLRTSDPKVATDRRKVAKERMIADVFHGDTKRDFVEVLELWAVSINKQLGVRTALRYASSLSQMRPLLDGRGLGEIDGRLVAEIIRARSASGVTNATIKRDLVALSSVINYAIDQGWREDNPVLPRMRRIKEKREPIVLPNPAHVDLVIGRCPGMIAHIVQAAIATGARQDELLKARREHIDHERRQMTLIGKGRKLRVISLDPYGGYEMICGIPAYAHSPLLFWHSKGQAYKNFASQFAAIVARTAVWATEAGLDFRSFRFHDLRHLHAVNWLKDGRSIYDLQNRLGHTSIKTTETYCTYLTPEEQRTAKGLGSAPKATTTPVLKLVDSV
jgi:integrase/recombinase XerD